MKNILLTGVFLGALAASPAHATLQIALQVGPDAFFCADNTACDTNPATGVIQVANTVVDGIQVDGSIQGSDHGLPFPSINTSSLDVINTLTTPVTATVAVSDTDFPAIAATFISAGSGTWQGPSGSAITMGWFVDPANAQGADNAFDTPGTLIDTFSNASFGRTSAFSHNGSTILNLFAPFSMTLASTISMAPSEALINRGQALVTEAVPEPATWAMLLVGFIGMAWGALTRKRLRQRLAHY
jgi:hypothetical protein